MKMLFALCLLIFTQVSLADEGMWLLNQFPSNQVAKKYGFKPTQEWLDHVRLSSARLAGGCSASFVSGNGLVMTNHHCAHSCIEQLSKAGKDYVASGFYAKNESDEVRCPEIEVNKLLEITDVTDAVKKATSGLKDKAFNDALKATMTRLETDCSEKKETLRCDVVTLFHGGKYHLYKYRRFQDVRLVFAPEFAIAFFGGDPDNFMFPRYDFDISFLRVYENDKPYASKDHFAWSKAGAKDGDLTFVSGNPGKTARLQTVSELEFYRDYTLMDRLFTLAMMRGILTEFAQRGAEQKRVSGTPLFGVENSFKALSGHLKALRQNDFMTKRKAQELAFQKKINANKKWKAAYGSAWSDLEKANNQLKNIYTRLNELEYAPSSSKLYAYAKSLVRATAEYQKPNEQRLREYSDSNKPQVKMMLQSKAPIHEDLEIELLTFQLTKLREKLSADDSFVKKVLGRKSPREVAEAAIKSSKLKDPQFRINLLEAGAAAVEKSDDPMIRLAWIYDPEARAVRKNYEDNIESKIKQADEKIAQAHFAVEGDKTYPDATFTLRLSYGQMKGYQEGDHFIPPQTEIGGAFARRTDSEPFALPASWLKSEKDLQMTTPFNMCSTNDIIGGNSGSPVINKAGEVVGLIFDGNIESLGGNFYYDAAVNRAVAVHSAGITELLNHVYHADRIVKDLTAQ
jgi:hypothetical protein